MEDPDLIACLYPFVDGKVVGENAQDVIEAGAKRHQFIPPRLSEVNEEPQLSRSERESTPLERPREKVPAYFYHPGLELRFSRSPQTPFGFVFGTDENSDIVLPKSISTISFHHFALTFDDHYRPIVKDLGSSNGTEVTYDTRGKGNRSNFVWIIGGHGTPQEIKTIVINVNKDLKFQIVVAHHDITSPQYIDNVNRFRQGMADAGNLLGRLDLGSRPQTERASGAHTPGTGPIFLKKKLGEGTFGVVTHLWNVSTAEECAVKEPSARAIQRRWVRPDEWMKEARIMKRVSHDHIVALIGSDFDPHPRLRLEYVPGGTLEDYTNLSTADCLQILRQCLSALVYLHGQEPPIVHRDIKPSNILVQYRHSDGIFVKLGDFGLSREGPDPTTICGSLRYLAPEVHNEHHRRNDTRVARYDRRSYTLAVDIWSLGVTVLECVYDLPSSNATGVLWCEEIVEKLQQELKRDPDDLKQFLCDAMVILQPELRGTAQHCYGQVLPLVNSAQDRPLTPTPSRAVQGYRQPGSPYSVEDQQTVARQDTYRASTGSSQRPSLDEDPAEIRRLLRSDGPPPDSVVSPPPTRKRTKDSRSSSDRNTKRPAVSSQSPLPSEVLDALHPLGGGSSLAALIGQEVAHSNFSTTRSSTPRGVRNPVDDSPNRAQLSEVYLPEPDLVHPAGENVSVQARAQGVAPGSTDNERELAARLLLEISQGS
ncbi:kinase-like protein [Thermothelomyces heterothallicus CBS 203.75]